MVKASLRTRYWAIRWALRITRGAIMSLITALASFAERRSSAGRIGHRDVGVQPSSQAICIASTRFEVSQ